MRQIRRRKRLPAQYVLAQADAQVEPHPSSEVQAAAAAPGTTSVITCTSSAKGFSFVSMTLASSMTCLFSLSLGSCRSAPRTPQQKAHLAQDCLASRRDVPLTMTSPSGRSSWACLLGEPRRADPATAAAVVSGMNLPDDCPGCRPRREPCRAVRSAPAQSIGGRASAQSSAASVSLSPGCPSRLGGIDVLQPVECLANSTNRASLRLSFVVARGSTLMRLQRPRPPENPATAPDGAL